MTKRELMELLANVPDEHEIGAWIKASDDNCDLCHGEFEVIYDVEMAHITVVATKADILYGLDIK